MHPENRLGPYDKLPQDHELVLRYKLKFFARGGEHLVYLIDNHPDIVVKVSTYKIKDSVLNVTERGLDSEDKVFEEDAKSKYKGEIDSKNDEIRKLRNYFGVDHTLKERRYLMKVPVSLALLQEIFIDDYFGRSLPESAANIREVWTHVIVQEFTEIIRDPSIISATYGHFIEDEDLEENKYVEVTRSLLSQNSAVFNMEEFLDIQDHSKNESLSKLLLLAQTDENLKKQVAIFVETAIRYTKETGQILAMAGEHNIVFRKDVSGWTFVLVDVLPNSPNPIFQKTIDASQKIVDRVSLTQEDKENIKRCLNFVRVINGIAASIGLPDRLILPEVFLTTDILALLDKK